MEKNDEGYTVEELGFIRDHLEREFWKDLKRKDILMDCGTADNFFFQIIDSTESERISAHEAAIAAIERAMLS